MVGSEARGELVMLLHVMCLRWGEVHLGTWGWKRWRCWCEIGWLGELKYQHLVVTLVALKNRVSASYLR